MRLSSFTTRPVSVGYQVQDESAAVLGNGMLVFSPGETLKRIPVNVTGPESHELIRVSLSDPVNAELTGMGSYFFVSDRETGGVALISRGAVWKYHDLREDLGTTWREEAYDDSGWGEGPAELGAGAGGEATVIDRGPDGPRTATAYFRNTSTVPNPRAFGGLEFEMRRDDGAVIYVNGAEVYRDSNVPDDATYGTYTDGQTPSESVYTPISVDASVLTAGTNVIAVELHQVNATSSDLSFDLELSGTSLPRLKMVDYDGDFLLYWLDPGFEMEEAETLPGPWMASDTKSPVEVVPDQEQRFFRLRSR